MPIMQTVIQGGGTTPTGTLQITANDTYDVTDYASAEVQVPTTAPDYYISRDISGGTLYGANASMDLHNITSVAQYKLAYALQAGHSSNNQPAFVNATSLTTITENHAFYYCCESSSYSSSGLSNVTSISGNYVCSNMFAGASCVSTGLTSLQSIGAGDSAHAGSCCESMFMNCRQLTSTDLGNLTTINTPQILTTTQGVRTCAYMFKQCISLTSTGLTSLEYIRGANALYQMFYGCTGLTNIALNSLVEITNEHICDSMFESCTGLVTAELPSLEKADAKYGFEYTFKGCSNLTSFRFPKLKSVKNDYVLYGMFTNCSSLREVYFDALRSDSFGTYTNQFNSMLQSCNAVTIHFPPQIQSVIGSWTSVLACFGATSSSVVFDAGAQVTVSIPSGYTVYINGLDVTNESTTYVYIGDNEVLSVSSDGKIGKYNFVATSSTTSFVFDPTQITYNEFTITSNESGATYTVSATTDWISGVIATVDSNNKVYCSAGCELTVSGTLSGYYANPVTQSTDISGTITLTFGVAQTIVYNPSDLLSAISGDITYASEDTGNNLFLYHYPTNTTWAGSVQLQLTPPAGTTTIIISTGAYVSSEANYDFGFISLGTQRVTPSYSNIKNGVISNGVYLFRQSGTNNTMTPVNYTCTDPTQTVLTLGWGQDSSLSGTNTLYVQPITITYVVA